MPTITPTRPSTSVNTKPRRTKGPELARYREPETGAWRAIVALSAKDGATLVVDRLVGTKADARVVARIAPEEDASNAQLMATMYAEDPERGVCRELTNEDMQGAAEQSRSVNDPGDNAGAETGAEVEADAEDVAPVDPTMVLHHDDGGSYSLRSVNCRPNGASQELHWVCEKAGECKTMTLRDTIAHFEAYEPFMAMTTAAIAAGPGQQNVSVAILKSELKRQEESPTVLNRGIREAVLKAVNDREDLSLSVIAARCGRQHNRANNCVSGDTTWLQRRIGIRNESASDKPTHWVSTEVLALIARKGLGIAPREVEV
jgi:hypothetical protein